MVQNHASFDGAARLQDSRLRKIYVLPPRCKRRQDHGGQSLRRFLHMRRSTNCACLDKFRFALLNPAKGRSEGTYEGPLHHYLGCAIALDLDAGTTSLLQVHYIERVCQKYGQWNVTPPENDDRYSPHG